VVSIIEADVETVLGAEKEQARSYRVFLDTASEAQHMVVEAFCDLRPGLSVIFCPIRIRGEVTHLVCFDRQIGFTRFPLRRINPPNNTVDRPIRQVCCDVRPRVSVITTDVDLAIVRSSVEDPLLDGRFIERIDHAAIFNPDIIGGQTAADSLATLVICGQIRTYDIPALSSVPGTVNMLASHKNGVVVMR
jgi:hypothetical protein